MIKVRVPVSFPESLYLFLLFLFPEAKVQIQTIMICSGDFSQSHHSCCLNSRLLKNYKKYTKKLKEQAVNSCINTKFRECGVSQSRALKVSTILSLQLDTSNRPVTKSASRLNLCRPPKSWLPTQPRCSVQVKTHELSVDPGLPGTSNGVAKIVSKRH